MGWKYKNIDIFEAVEIVKASPNEFVTQDVKIRNCVRAEDASEAINQVLRALWLARAERAKWVANNEDALEDYREEHPGSYLNNFYVESFDEWSWKWEWAERKCREKAREFE